MPRTAEQVQRHREGELRRARSGLKGRMAPTFAVRLAGTSMSPGYPQTHLDLSVEEQARDADPLPFPNFGGDMAQEAAEKDWEEHEERRGRPIELELIRQPENPHDPNAVSVQWGGEHIGYIPSALAQRLAGELDAGFVWSAELEHVYVDPAKPQQPGVSITARRLSDPPARTLPDRPPVRRPRIEKPRMSRKQRRRENLLADQWDLGMRPRGSRRRQWERQMRRQRSLP